MLSINLNAVLNRIQSHLPKVSPQVRQVGLGFLGVAAAYALWSVGRRFVSWIIEPRNTSAKVTSCFDGAVLSAIASTEDTKTLFSILNQATSKVYNSNQTVTSVPPIFEKMPLMQKNRVLSTDKVIHANHILRDPNVQGRSERGFIASVAPCFEEIGGSPSLSSFWEMVYFQNVEQIFAIRCSNDQYHNYAPDPVFRKTIEAGSYSVTLLEKTTPPPTETFKLNPPTPSALLDRDIQRITCNDWVFDQPYSVKHLAIFVEKMAPFNKILVHGVAGVGRTATLIVAAFLKDEIGSGRITQGNFKQSLMEIILDVRSQRGPSAVENQEQFDLLFAYGQMLLASTANKTRGSE